MLETKGADPCPWVGVWGRQQGEGVMGAESLWIREHSSKGRGLGVASRQREQFTQRHGKRATDCPARCRGRSQECQTLPLERESSKASKTLEGHRS